MMLTSKNNDMSLGTKSGKMEVSGAVFSMKEKEIETVDLAQVIESMQMRISELEGVVSNLTSQLNIKVSKDKLLEEIEIQKNQEI